MTLLNNYTAIYWLTRLDNIAAFIVISAIILLFASIMAFVWTHMEMDYSYGDEKKSKSYKLPKRLLILSIVLFSINVFIPSKEDVVLIYAGGKTMDFVQSDTSLSKIPSQTTKIITDYLQKQIEGQKPTK